MFLPAELIKKKRNHFSHSCEEIKWLIDSYVKGEVPDYQMSAWLMAVYFNGMDTDEIATLTACMRDSGKVLNFSHLGTPCVDKHSTGGVGDKASLILAPLAAACGVPVPMIAGRGLGHTGGTLDKLESIPGFRINLTEQEFLKGVNDHNLAIMGQTEEICPADKKLYALRDVTGTVESLPLICGSIMSKKLAEGISGLVLDVKFGSGAFMKTLEQARQLALLLKQTGEKNNVRVTALLTDMNQPLGRYIGNSLEVKECIEILQNQTCVENGVDFYEPTRKLSLALTVHMVRLAGLADSEQEATLMVEQKLRDFSAFECFKELCRRQGPGQFDQLPEPTRQQEYLAETSGCLIAIDNEKLGLASLALGAGRKKTTDLIDPVAGMAMHCRLGQNIKTGDRLLTLFGSDKTIFENAVPLVKEAFIISESDSYQPIPLIAEVING